MPADVSTCPKCGALITPQLARCRQCGNYLHGNRFEGFLFEHILPKNLAASPGTGLTVLFIGLYYALMVVLAGIDQIFAFSSYSLRQLGSDFGVGVMMGQYWRFVTSVFSHGDITHVGFNVYALLSAGPLVEQIFDRKKMLFLFLASGVLSMVTSHVYGVLLGGHVLHNSVGASGAISGLIGAALFGSRRMGPIGRPIAQGMTRWALYILVFGLVVDGIDNAAHIGGFVVGAAVGQLMPLGLIKTVAMQRVASLGLFLGLALVLGSMGLMLADLRGFPASLKDDAQPRRALFFSTYSGADWDYSGQKLNAEACIQRVREGDFSPDAVQTCELAVRSMPEFGGNYMNLAAVLEHNGNSERAEALRKVAARLPRGRLE